MKYLIMCEGSNELEVIKMLLEHDKLIFTNDDLLNLVPYHARQIGNNATVKSALNLYHGNIHILRVGDKLNDKLKIPKEYERKIKDIKKYCTKPELEMLLIISENKHLDFEKVKSQTTPKRFSKENIVYNRIRYNGSTAFYREYYRERIELLVNAISRYKQLKGKHEKDEFYLADLLK
ncbi:MAG TPA: GNAT family acetyltransferase [Candidatus Dwaynia gallinarum]|nr:GNAT family acetyltransferase [Candidatus Dwaynia gallinarum]